jgi:hypothetical protein
MSLLRVESRLVNQYINDRASETVRLSKLSILGSK